MGRGLAALWTCLLGAGLILVLFPASSITTTSETSPRPPRLTGCVFLERANVTCHWEAGDAQATHYTLRVQRWRKCGADSSPTPFACTTPRTHCTAGLNGSSVRFTFCVTVTAHGPGWSTTSECRCQRGRIEVMLFPVTLDHVRPVHGTPRCLNVTWSRNVIYFPVSEDEIKSGTLNSQIEVASQGQLSAQVRNVTVRGYSFLACLFRPDASYTIRLRHRYQGPASPWSPWSNAQQGRTAEGAPAAAPELWRRVQQTHQDGQRLVSLLWKALPHFLANGRLLFYNVTCQTGSTQTLSNHGNCRDLDHSDMSCTLLLSAKRCSCALTAYNSAGSSPEAQIWLLGASETGSNLSLDMVDTPAKKKPFISEPPALSQITVRPLDDNNVIVSWAAPADGLVSGFIVEWFAVREKNNSILHWEKLNKSCTAFVISEGVKPMERYAVSVRALYGERGAGKDRTQHIYTRQGVPSAGPSVEVQWISGGTVVLSWRPVPVELRHGFIRNYTLHYTGKNQPSTSVIVPGHVRHRSLQNLLPGHYSIFMRANTDAGPGAAGTIANVHIGSKEFPMLMDAILPLILTPLVLALMVYLAQNKMVKQKLCQFVPNPSNSSLAQWTPKTTMENMKQPSKPENPNIKYSEVILLGESESQSSDPDLVITYQSVSGSQTPQNTSVSEKEWNWSPVRAQVTPSPGLSYCSTIYSNIIFSETLKSPPPPLPSTPYCRSYVWQHVSDIKIELDRDSKPPEGSRAGAPQEGISATAFS